MDRVCVRLAAALMLSTAPLIAASSSFAQDKGSGGPAAGMRAGGGGGAGPARAESRPQRSAEPRAERSGGREARSSETRGGKSAEAKQPREKPAKATAEKPTKPERTMKSAERPARAEKPAAKAAETSKTPPRSAKATAGAPDAAKQKGNAQAQSEKIKPNDRNAAAQSEKTKPGAQPNRAAESAPSGKTGVPPPAEQKKAEQTRQKPDQVKSVQVDNDRRGRVSSRFRDENRDIRHIRGANVDLVVGRRMPRDWDYRPIPYAILDVVPEYSGYRYAYVDDDYVIVDPETYEVVSVYDERGGPVERDAYLEGGDSGSYRATRSGGSSSSSGSASQTADSGPGDKCPADIALSGDDKTFVIDNVRELSPASANIDDPRAGIELPQSATIEPFPTEVTAKLSKLESCRFAVLQDRVAIVDPTDKKIIEMLN